MKETPIEKVPEAWTAIVDGRVRIEEGSNENAGKAVVSSSNGEKEYIVTWRDNGKIFTSTDPATFWQGYAGYPVLAVMMTIGKLTYDRNLAQRFEGVEWKTVNTKFRNNYAKALQHVEEERGIDPDTVATAAGKVLAQLQALDLTLKRK